MQSYTSYLTIFTTSFLKYFKVKTLNLQPRGVHVRHVPQTSQHHSSHYSNSNIEQAKVMSKADTAGQTANNTGWLFCLIRHHLRLPTPVLWRNICSRWHAQVRRDTVLRPKYLCSFSFLPGTDDPFQRRGKNRDGMWGLRGDSSRRRQRTQDRGASHVLINMHGNSHRHAHTHTQTELQGRRRGESVH